MPSIDISKERIPGEALFWQDVSLALTGVYKLKDKEAAGLIEQRRVRLLDAHPLEQALVMHENPVVIAAGLIGTQATGEHIRYFIRLTVEHPYAAAAD